MCMSGRSCAGVRGCGCGCGCHDWLPAKLNETLFWRQTLIIGRYSSATSTQYPIGIRSHLRSLTERWVLSILFISFMGTRRVATLSGPTHSSWFFETDGRTSKHGEVVKSQCTVPRADRRSSRNGPNIDHVIGRKPPVHTCVCAYVRMYLSGPTRCFVGQSKRRTVPRTKFRR